MSNYNYFEEVNPNWKDSTFDLNNRNDPDMKSRKLIKDLSDKFLNNKKTPSGKIIKVIDICRTTDTKKRWYAKIQVYSADNRYLSTYGIASDYIGASVNWALTAGVQSKDILEHLYQSRRLCGHIIFPTWYFNFSEKSWELYPEGISVNMAKGGEKGYYDRIDYTLFAIREWYCNRNSKLFSVIEKNRDWFELFCTFEKFVEYFHLQGLLDDNNNIINLMSYNEETKLYDKTIEEDAENTALPIDAEGYMKYIYGCNKFLLTRDLF